MSEPLKLDDFLKAQVSLFTATVELVEGKEGYVKITPFSPGGKCRCNASLVVPKDTIESVSPTGETQSCCGKVLKVVAVQFVEGKTLDLKRFFAQIANPASNIHSHPPMHGAEMVVPNTQLPHPPQSGTRR